MRVPLIRNKKKLEEAQEFNPDPSFGLSNDEVASRINGGFVNKTKKHVTKSYAQIFFDNFFNFFNILLFVIFIVMLTAHLPWSSYFFMLILFANSTLGLIQDIHARHLVDKLKVITDPKVDVLRNGKVISLATNEIVLGDIMILKAGDQIPADSIVVEGSCSVDESLLSGESAPVKKNLGSSLLSGSYLKKGTCKAQAIKVGSANYAETLQSQAASFKRPKSEIKNAIGRVFAGAGIISILFGVANLITWLLQKDVSYEVFVGRLSGSMVAMIPAGMYLLTSLTLAVGVISLAKKRMLVQELYCIESLARVDVLCLDKTGTLTDGSMEVDHIYPVSSYRDEEITSFISKVVYSTNDSNATALALKNYFPIDSLAKKAKVVLPFDSDTKYSAASFEGEGTYILGAYGFVDAKPNMEAESRIKIAAEGGYRVLCLYKNKKETVGDKIPSKSDLLAVILIRDHIKADAKKNIEWFKKNGVAVRVISGDDPITVSQIAGKVGVEGAARYISCEGKSDDELRELSKEYTVFGRVNPEQKEVLVKAYQAQGHKVAMTGDGVNDILALKAADCSIAMASGAAAARNVSHLVSLDNGFSRLPDVVDQGRRVINNLQRTCSLFLSKTLFAIILSLGFLVSRWAGGDAYPFTTQNMLVWEILSIGFASFFLALQPSHERLKGSFLGNIMVKAIPAGFVEAFSVFLVFMIAMFWPQCFSSYSGTSAFYGPGGLERTILRGAIVVSVLVFTSLSFISLFRFSLPLNRYRIVLFCILAVLAAGLFISDYFLPDGPATDLFGLSWENLNVYANVTILGIIVFCTGLYFLLDLLVRKIACKISRGEIQYEN